MHITSANIPVPASKTLTQPAADQASKRRQEIDAGASDKKNHTAPAPQIIEAEYVELYSPPKTGVITDAQVLDSTLSPESSELNTSKSTPAVTSYQIKHHAAPPPGSIIDIFA
jgi:hypothetical protein